MKFRGEVWVPFLYLADGHPCREEAISRSAIAPEAVKIRKSELLADSVHLRSAIIHHPIRFRMARVESHELSVGHEVHSSQFLRFPYCHDAITQYAARATPHPPGRHRVT